MSDLLVPVESIGKVALDMTVACGPMDFLHGFGSGDAAALHSSRVITALRESSLLQSNRARLSATELGALGNVARAAAADFVEADARIAGRGLGIL